MKPGSGSVMDLGFIEILSERRYMLPAPRIGPAENLRCWFSFCVYPYKTVPKRRSRDMRDLAVNAFGFFQNIVDSGHDLLERFIGIDLGAVVVGRDQRTLVLDHGLWQDVAALVVESGANARCAYIKS